MSSSYDELSARRRRMGLMAMALFGAIVVPVVISSEKQSPFEVRVIPVILRQSGEFTQFLEPGMPHTTRCAMNSPYVDAASHLRVYTCVSDFASRALLFECMVNSDVKEAGCRVVGLR